MESYQHNGRKLIQMLFRATDKPAPPGPPAGATTGTTSMQPETDWPSPSNLGPRFNLVKGLRKVKKPPARIPPLEAKDRPNNNNALSNHNNQSDEKPIDVDLDNALSSVLSDVTVDDMDRVIDDLKQWRQEHANKIAAMQIHQTTTDEPTGHDDPDEKNDEQDDHDVLLELYEQAKKRWGSPSPVKSWKPLPEGVLASPAQEDKLQEIVDDHLAEKLAALRSDVFQLQVQGLLRDRCRRMNLPTLDAINNEDDDSAFDAHLLELERGVQTYANDLDDLLSRLGTLSPGEDTCEAE
ncbi:unnamed protein product [Aphanomyces euteiches]